MMQQFLLPTKNIYSWVKKNFFFFKIILTYQLFDALLRQLTKKKKQY